MLPCKLTVLERILRVDCMIPRLPCKNVYEVVAEPTAAPPVQLPAVLQVVSLRSLYGSDELIGPFPSKHELYDLIVLLPEPCIATLLPVLSTNQFFLSLHLPHDELLYLTRPGQIL